MESCKRLNTAWIHMSDLLCSVLRAIRSTDIAYNAVSQAKKTYQCYPDVVQLSTETAYKSYLLTMLTHHFRT
jgi:hypothetical protein